MSSGEGGSITRPDPAGLNRKNAKRGLNHVLGDSHVGGSGHHLLEELHLSSAIAAAFVQMLLHFIALARRGHSPHEVKPTGYVELTHALAFPDSRGKSGLRFPG